MLNFNNVIKEAHITAKEKGWWEEKRSKEHCMALVVSEIGEAIEDVRNNKLEIKSAIEIGNENCRLHDIKPKPIGLPIEIADVFIRYADWLGSRVANFQLDNVIPESGISRFKASFSGSILEGLYRLTKYLFIINDDRCEEKYEFLFMINDFCKHYKIDLEKAIELKMSYNKTRPFKHGKEY